MANLAVEAASAKTIEEIAPKYLNSVISQEAQFNNYTGNLESAYVAEVYRQRKLSKRIHADEIRKIKRGVVKVGKRGGRYVKIVNPPRHEIRSRRANPDYDKNAVSGTHKYETYKEYDTKRIRYLKKWEKTGGYKSNRTHKRANYMRGRAQNFITIRNTAPYAASVQMGKGRHKHYNVLRGGLPIATAMRKEAGELLRTTVLQELKKAGFKVR